MNGVVEGVTLVIALVTLMGVVRANHYIDQMRREAEDKSR